MDGARVQRRGFDHRLRVRAGRFRHLDLHGRHGHRLHRVQPDQRPALQVPGAGPQQRRGGRGLRRVAERHAGDGAGRTDGPQRHGQRRAGGSDLDGARFERRGDDPALRIRAGLFRHLDLHGRDSHQHHGAQPDQRPVLRFPGAGGEPRRGECGLGFAVGHAHGHAGGAGHAVWPECHGRQPAGEAQLGPALRRGGAHALRIRAGPVRYLDLHGRDSHQHHGDGPDQRPDLHVPGAGGQQRRGERGLGFAVGHAHDHGAGGAREPELPRPATVR